MANIQNNGEVVPAISASNSSKVKIRMKGQVMVYEADKDLLIRSSQYFEGMFRGGQWKESHTNEIELDAEGTYKDTALWILLRWFEKGAYSLHAWLSEPPEDDWEPINWLQISTFALHMHELWLDVFVLADKYGNEAMRRQIVDDLANSIGIFLSSANSHLIRYDNIHPIPISAPLFRLVHYERITNRMEGSYPTEFHELWLQAMRGFYNDGNNTQDNAFHEMATRNPTIAVSALRDYAASLTPMLPGVHTYCQRPRLQVTNRALYELLWAHVKESISRVRVITQERVDQEWPKWYLDWKKLGTMN